MTSHTDNRKPLPELTLLAAGIVAAVIAGKAIGLEYLVRGIHLSLHLLRLAAAFSAVLSSRGLAFQAVSIVFQAVSTVLCLAAVVFGPLWWNSHRHDNEIFSPVFVGGLLPSGILNLTYTLRQRHSKNSTQS